MKNAHDSVGGRGSGGGYDKTGAGGCKQRERSRKERPRVLRMRSYCPVEGLI